MASSVDVVLTDSSRGPVPVARVVVWSPNGAVCGGGAAGWVMPVEASERAPETLARSAGVAPAGEASRTGFRSSGGTSCSSVGSVGCRSPGISGTLPWLRSTCWLRMKLYLAFDSIAASTPSRRMRGRMKTIRLVLTLSMLRVLNSSPMIGIEPRKGTCELLSRTSSEISPPSTMMPPSSTITLVVIVRLLVIRSVVLTASNSRAMLGGFLRDLEQHR